MFSSLREVRQLRENSWMGMPRQHPGPTFDGTKNENFIWSTPNGPIRKVNRLKSKSEHLPKILPTTGWSEPSLRKYLRKNENMTIKNLVDQVRYTVLLRWMVDISDVFIIEGGQANVEGFDLGIHPGPTFDGTKMKI